MNATTGSATDAYSVFSTCSATPGFQRAHSCSSSRPRPVLPSASSSTTVTAITYSLMDWATPMAYWASRDTVATGTITMVGLT